MTKTADACRAAQRLTQWWKNASMLRRLDGAASLLAVVAAMIWPSGWMIAGAAVSVLLFVVDPAALLRDWLTRRLTTRRPRQG